MNSRHGSIDTSSTVNDIYLHFRPWIAKRTILHEYFSRSWGMFGAAEHTEHSGVAAMLTGQSIELAIKAMLELVGKEPPITHKITECLDTFPELRTLLEQLWGADLNSLIQFVDEDINSSQMRYGAAGSHKDKETQLIAASIAHKPTSWTTPVTELYEELMCSIGAAIWENYPAEDRKGQSVRRQVKIHPMFSGEGRNAVYPHFPSSVYGLMLLAEVNGIETEYGSIIPIEGTKRDATHWVRVRIGKDTAVDQWVIQENNNLSLAGFRWIGRPVDGVRLKLYEARSTLLSVRPQARKEQTT